MDLILTANSKAEVSLHRSLDLQTVWTKSPPDCEIKLVRKLTWKPDGHAFAIAYSYNEAESSVEDSVSKALVLVVSLENEEVNSINVDGDVTCLNWCESKVKSTVPDGFPDYFPKPPPLSNPFRVGVSFKSKHLLKEIIEGMMNFLVIGSSIGDLKVVVGGFLSCCSLSINSLFQVENKKHWITSAVFSSDMKFMFVFVEQSANSFTSTERNTQILVLDTSVLAINISGINLLKTRIGRILVLTDRITEVQLSLTEVWECVKVAEIASNFNKYDEHFDSLESVVADFCELIMFGVLSDALEKFLLQSLKCDRVKRIIKSVEDNCLNVESLVSGYLKPYLEELFIILVEMKGMAQLKHFNVLGLAEDLFSIACNYVRALIFKASEFHMVVQSLEQKYTAFYQWLYVIITQLNSDDNRMLDFSEGLATENSLSLIMDYLNSICEISVSYNEPISFFQHLSQYFEDTLSKTVEPNNWQYLLEDRPDLVTVANFIPVGTNLSLDQAFKNVYESISSVCSAHEKAVTPLFSVKNVIDLPESLLDCSIGASCYFTDNQTLMTAFVNYNNTGDFSLLEVLPHEQSYIKRQKILRLANENDYKCLDVKWYPNEKIFALFEEKENRNLYLIQIEKSKIDVFNTDVVSINAIQDGVFICRIPYFPMFCFAVSCNRKCGVAVSKNKKRIKTFDIGFDENSFEQD